MVVPALFVVVHFFLVVVVHTLVIDHPFVIVIYALPSPSSATPVFVVVFLIFILSSVHTNLIPAKPPPLLIVQALFIAVHFLFVTHSFLVVVHLLIVF